MTSLAETTTAAHPRIACAKCEDGHLVPTDDRLGDRCDRCSYDNTVCDCGSRMTFDPHHRGTTCGGLDLVGAKVCAPCGTALIARYLSRPADAVDWRLAKGGRSIDAGEYRLRAESKAGDDVGALMARIVQLPALEIEVAALRLELAKRKGAG